MHQSIQHAPAFSEIAYGTTKDQQGFGRVVILFPYCWNCEISNILIIADRIKYWKNTSSLCRLKNERGKLAPVCFEVH